jgi:hypothetical protein
MKPRKMAAEMVARALQAQREREGVRVKVRLSDDLAARVGLCAADVGMKLGEWVNCACRNYLAGRCVSVADTEKTDLATRDKSECYTVRAPAGMAPTEIKRAVTMSVVYCEARRITYNPQPPAHYLLERSEN